MNADKGHDGDRLFFGVDHPGDRTARTVNSMLSRVGEAYLPEGWEAFPSLMVYHNGGNSISAIRLHHAIGVHPVKDTASKVLHGGP
jgi:hypothetical protein